METHELIRRAEHCILTGQPNLALLYMQKAQKQCRRERWESATPPQRFMLGVEGVNDAIRAAGEAAEAAVAALTKAFENWQPPRPVIFPQEFGSVRSPEIKGWWSDGRPVY